MSEQLAKALEKAKREALLEGASNLMLLRLLCTALDHRGWMPNDEDLKAECEKRFAKKDKAGEPY